MMMAMPTEFYIVVGVCLAVMGFSAFYLGAPDWRLKGAARAGLAVSAAGLFVFTMTYLSIFVAVLIVILPVFLIVAFFTDLFSGLF